MVAEGKSEELVRVLEKIFCERCGLNFHVSTKRVEPPKSKRRKNAELELEQEVAALEKRYMSEALKLSGNNLTRAAALLGVTRFSMKRKMEREDGEK